MRKGIIKIILIYSLVMSFALIISSIIEEILFDYDSSMQFRFLIAFFVPTLLGFILLGVGVNKKYESGINYWKFVIIGSVISIVSSFFYTFYLLFFGVYLILSNEEPWELWLNYYLEICYKVFPPIMGVMIFQSVIVGLFYRKLKKQQFSFSDSLDSDILND